MSPRKRSFLAVDLLALAGIAIILAIFFGWLAVPLFVCIAVTYLNGYMTGGTE